MSKPSTSKAQGQGGGGAALLKVVVRRLPPDLPEATFWRSVAEFTGREDESVGWKVYHAGTQRKLGKEATPSRAYIQFKTAEGVVAFHQGYKDHVFRSRDGTIHQPLIEFAPYQRTPAAPKPDGKVNSIETDPVYVQFLASLSGNPSGLPEAAPTDVVGNGITPLPATARDTPLLVHMRAKAAAEKEKEGQKRKEKEALNRAKQKAAREGAKDKAAAAGSLPNEPGTSGNAKGKQAHGNKGKGKAPAANTGGAETSTGAQGQGGKGKGKPPAGAGAGGNNRQKKPQAAPQQQAPKILLTNPASTTAGPTSSASSTATATATPTSSASGATQSGATPAAGRGGGASGAGRGRGRGGGGSGSSEAQAQRKQVSAALTAALQPGGGRRGRGGGGRGGGAAGGSGGRGGAPAAASTGAQGSSGGA